MILNRFQYYTVGATQCGRPFIFRNIKREKNIAFGYPKAEALAQFVHSALFFSSPAAAHACSLSNAKQALRLVAFGASASKTRTHVA